MNNAFNSKFIMNIKYENYFEKDLDELRKELKIIIWFLIVKFIYLSSLLYFLFYLLLIKYLIYIII